MSETLLLSRQTQTTNSRPGYVSNRNPGRTTGDRTTDFTEKSGRRTPVNIPRRRTGQEQPSDRKYVTPKLPGCTLEGEGVFLSKTYVKTTWVRGARYDVTHTLPLHVHPPLSWVSVVEPSLVTGVSRRKVLLSESQTQVPVFPRPFHKGM